MAGLFEDYRGPDAERLELERKRLFRLIEETARLDWPLLTSVPRTSRPWCRGATTGRRTF